MNTQVENYRESLAKRTEIKQAQIKAFNHMISVTNLKVAKFEQELPTLEVILFKQGLKIDRLSITKSGSNFDVWEEDDKLVVALVLVKTEDSKFKFIPFNGYTSNGASKNADRRKAKADKLKTFIAQRIYVQGLYINDNSMEEGSNKNRDIVLMDIMY